MKFVYFFLFSIFSFSQNTDIDVHLKTPDSIVNNEDVLSNLIFITSENEARTLAEKHIADNTVCLLLQGGIAPVFIKTDKDFEAKYKIQFREYGCSGPKYEIMVAYNTVVFNFLTITYGNRWKREIRKDVIGYKKWKK